jgi:hypothetical protein
MQFNSNDYNSDYGFNTHVWGPMQWSMLHIISFNYPVKPTNTDKLHYYEYIMSLQNVLPCKACRENLTINLKALKFGQSKLKDRDTFSRFIYDLHNHVNVMLGKAKYLTYEEVRDRYELFRAKCVNGAPVVPLHKTGCIHPLNNIKSQCIIHITPLKTGRESFVIDNKCYPDIKGASVRKSSKKSSKKSSGKKSSKKSKKSKKSTSRKSKKGKKV